MHRIILFRADEPSCYLLCKVIEGEELDRNDESKSRFIQSEADIEGVAIIFGWDNSTPAQDFLEELCNSVRIPIDDPGYFDDNAGRSVGKSMGALEDRLTKIKAIIIIEGGCLQGVYGVDEYDLIDVDNMKERGEEADKIIDERIKGQKEAVEAN